MNAKLDGLLEEAEAFHGHLGPFLVVGLKAGQLALRELGTKKGDPGLRASGTSLPNPNFLPSRRNTILDWMHNRQQASVLQGLTRRDIQFFQERRDN